MDPYSLGFRDAARGHTACPFGDPESAALWAEGYDNNPDAELPRFGSTKRKRK